jgi:hypothetical protein
MNTSPSTVFNGQLSAEDDAVVIAAPADPLVGENHGFWFFEDGGAFTFHVHLQADSPLWDVRREMVHVLLADGRVMSDWQFGLGTTPAGPGSACTRTAAIVPFSRWRLDYAGMPFASTGEHMAKAIVDLERAPRVPVELALDICIAADPWAQGRLTPSSASAEATAALGGFRHEQLFRASGEVRVGDKRRRVTGTGLRTHRIGRRDMAQFAGHSWQTVLFPSGKGFGFQRHFLPDGTISFDEGFILDADGALIPVNLVDVPPMRNSFSGEKHRTVLEHEGREIVIETETVAIHHWTREPADGRNRMRFGVDLTHGESLVLSNGCARAEWDGEVGYGLLERSCHADLLK